MSRANVKKKKKEKKIQPIGYWEQQEEKENGQKLVQKQQWGVVLALVIFMFCNFKR